MSWAKLDNARGLHGGIKSVTVSIFLYGKKLMPQLGIGGFYTAPGGDTPVLGMFPAGFQDPSLAAGGSGFDTEYADDAFD